MKKTEAYWISKIQKDIEVIATIPLEEHTEAIYKSVLRHPNFQPHHLNYFKDVTPEICATALVVFFESKQEGVEFVLNHYPNQVFQALKEHPFISWIIPVDYYRSTGDKFLLEALKTSLDLTKKPSLHFSYEMKMELLRQEVYRISSLINQLEPELERWVFIASPNEIEWIYELCDDELEEWKNFFEHLSHQYQRNSTLLSIHHQLESFCLEAEFDQKTDRWYLNQWKPSNSTNQTLATFLSTDNLIIAFPDKLGALDQAQRTFQRCRLAYRLNPLMKHYSPYHQLEWLHQNN